MSQQLICDGEHSRPVPLNIEKPFFEVRRFDSMGNLQAAEHYQDTCFVEWKHLPGPGELVQIAHHAHIEPAPAVE